MTTTVHNIHKERMQEGDVYIGRAGHDQDGYFGNPFSQRDRDQNVLDFEHWFLRRVISDKQYRRRVMKLQDKRLFCFCAPLACHGDVIVDWLERNAAYIAGATLRRRPLNG